MARQRETRCPGYIHPCIQHLYCLSAFLLYFWTVQRWENTTPVLKIFLLRVFISKRSRTLNLSVLLSPLWVSPRTNSSLPLSAQASSFPFVPVPRCYLTLHCAAWMLLWVPATGSPPGLDFTSEELLKGLEPAHSWEAGGDIPLLSSASSPPASRCGLLRCLQETAGEEDPTASQIRKHKARPAVSCTLRTFPDRLQKEILNPLPRWTICYITWPRILVVLMVLSQSRSSQASQLS